MEYAFREDYQLDHKKIGRLRKSYAPMSIEHTTLLDSQYLLGTAGRFQAFYAPTELCPSPEAKIILVGLTPGFSQMQLAAELFVKHKADVRDNKGRFEDLAHGSVAFAGPMRTNLCTMLDELGVPAHLDLTSSMRMFDEGRFVAATTSALMYPIFKVVACDGKHCTRRNCTATARGRQHFINFSGIGNLSRIAIFKEMLDDFLAPRLAGASDAVVIPLGVSASSGVRYLCNRNVIREDRVLWHMPHPSPGNGWRVRHFARDKIKLKKDVVRLFSRPDRVRPRGA